MSARQRLGTALLLVALLSAAWGWQWVEYRATVDRVEKADGLYAETILAAAEGALKEPCSTEAADVTALTRVLEDVRSRIGVSCLGLRFQNGETFALAGELCGGDAGAVRSRMRQFELPAEVSCTSCGQSGPPRPEVLIASGPPQAAMDCETQCRHCGHAGQQLQIELQYSSQKLNAAVSQAGFRALGLGGTFSLALMSLFLYARSRMRAATLKNDLVASTERVRSLEFLSRLSAGLAHETKNPLGAIRGFAEMLSRKKGEDPRQKDAALRIVEESDRLVARVDEFLLLSRPADLKRETFEMGALCSELSELVQFDLDPGQSIEVTGDSTVVNADREQVRRLLLNLLVNACENLGSGTRIQVRSANLDDDFELTVCDNGKGVPADIRDTLFEPYVTARSGGHGLGLAIATRIASEHGWRLELREREGWSTSLCLTGTRS